MSRIIKCDRCGGEVDPKKIGYVSIMQRGKGGELCGDNPFEEFDFCEKCMTLIADFVSRKPAVKPKTSRATAVSVMDAGKIRALAADGWSRDKIADEVGCSVPTVSKYLKGVKEC